MTYMYLYVLSYPYHTIILFCTLLYLKVIFPYVHCDVMDAMKCHLMCTECSLM